MGIFSFFGRVLRRKPLVPARQARSPQDIAAERARLEQNYRKNPRHVVNNSSELGNQMRAEIDAAARVQKESASQQRVRAKAAAMKAMQLAEKQRRRR